MDGDGHDGGGAHFEDALSRAWPGGLPLGESAFLRSLTAARREAVVRRLWAVLEAEKAEPDLTRIAATAGLSRTAFFQLRRRWAESRSLRSLAPYQTRESRASAPPAGDGRPAASQTPASPPAVPTPRHAGRHGRERLAALEAIRADPLAPSGAVADMVAARTGSTLDRRTLIGLVRQERRLLHFSPSNLLGAYGRSLLVDASALDLLLEEDGRRELAVVAMVVERASTLVLGYAVGRRMFGVDLQVLAARRAVANLSEWRADVGAETPVGMLVVAGPGPACRVEQLGAAAAGRLGEQAVVSKGRLRFGRRLAALIGQPGRVRLRPMATVPARNEPAIPGTAAPITLSTAEADALIGEELVRHNRSVLDGLRMVGLVGKGSASGAMSALIRSVFDGIGPC